MPRSMARVMVAALNRAALHRGWIIDGWLRRPAKSPPSTGGPSSRLRRPPGAEHVDRVAVLSRAALHRGPNGRSPSRIREPSPPSAGAALHRGSYCLTVTVTVRLLVAALYRAALHLGVVAAPWLTMSPDRSPPSTRAALHRGWTEEAAALTDSAAAAALNRAALHRGADMWAQPDNTDRRCPQPGGPSSRPGRPNHRGHPRRVAALNRAALHRGETAATTWRCSPQVAAFNQAALHRGSGWPWTCQKSAQVAAFNRAALHRGTDLVVDQTIMPVSPPSTWWPFIEAGGEQGVTVDRQVAALNWAALHRGNRYPDPLDVYGGASSPCPAALHRGRADMCV